MKQSDRHKRLTELFCSLCEVNNITVDWCVGVNAADPFQDLISLRCATITTDAEFAIALHELGHHVTHRETYLGPRRVRERVAWEWSREACYANDVPWTEEMTAVESECIEAWRKHLDQGRTER